nr:Protein MAM-5, isoform a [Haemonchus contortus]
MGRTVSLLVSEVISCQLGGGNVKYWYFKTGIESQLEVCIRQPPGSKDVNALRCYDGLSPNFIQQWIFRVIELPPLSQPFELIFRGTFYPPLDVIALTEINYTSTLCGEYTSLQ